ncbi:hypothetical protein ACQQ2N_06380 [Dokdonella sp. MW10]|uniref:hypothetical protein n=1 Tax=Dokdonella sp. MW10 TaxID=2992926 RepID=UPI003F81CB7D
MPRRPSDEKIARYEALKRFFVHWVMHVSPSPFHDAAHPHHPVNMLAMIERKASFSQALSGLRQAVNDSLEAAEDWTADRIRAADASLAGVGAPTLTELLVSRSKTTRAILRRGHLRSEAEYYLVSAVVADMNSSRPADELERMGEMLSAFEARASAGEHDHLA